MSEKYFPPEIILGKPSTSASSPKKKELHKFNQKKCPSKTFTNQGKTKTCWMVTSMILLLNLGIPLNDKVKHFLESMEDSFNSGKIVDTCPMFPKFLRPWQQKLKEEKGVEGGKFTLALLQASGYHTIVMGFPWYARNFYGDEAIIGTRAQRDWMKEAWKTLATCVSRHKKAASDPNYIICMVQYDTWSNKPIANTIRDPSVRTFGTFQAFPYWFTEIGITLQDFVVFIKRSPPNVRGGLVSVAYPLYPFKEVNASNETHTWWKRVEKELVARFDFELIKNAIYYIIQWENQETTVGAAHLINIKYTDSGFEFPNVNSHTLFTGGKWMILGQNPTRPKEEQIAQDAEAPGVSLKRAELKYNSAHIPTNHLDHVALNWVPRAATGHNIPFFRCGRDVWFCNSWGGGCQDLDKLFDHLKEITGASFIIRYFQLLCYEPEDMLKFQLGEQNTAAKIILQTPMKARERKKLQYLEKREAVSHGELPLSKDEMRDLRWSRPEGFKLKQVRRRLEKRRKQDWVNHGAHEIDNFRPKPIGVSISALKGGRSRRRRKRKTRRSRKRKTRRSRKRRRKRRRKTRRRRKRRK